MRAANDVVQDKDKKKEETKEELIAKTEKLSTSFLKNEKTGPPAKSKFGWGVNEKKSGYDQTKKEAEASKERKTQKDSRFGGSPKCPVCGKSVFFAEKLVALGETFHKTCFKCNTCSKTMNTAGEATDGQGLIYCKGCYAKKYGPKGIGFGTLGDTGISRTKIDEDL